MLRVNRDLHTMLAGPKELNPRELKDHLDGDRTIWHGLADGHRKGSFDLRALMTVLVLHHDRHGVLGVGLDRSTAEAEADKKPRMHQRHLLRTHRVEDAEHAHAADLVDDGILGNGRDVDLHALRYE